MVSGTRRPKVPAGRQSQTPVTIRAPGFAALTTTVKSAGHTRSPCQCAPINRTGGPAAGARRTVGPHAWAATSPRCWGRPGAGAAWRRHGGAGSTGAMGRRGPGCAASTRAFLLAGGPAATSGLLGPPRKATAGATASATLTGPFAAEQRSASALATKARSRSNKSPGSGRLILSTSSRSPASNPPALGVPAADSITGEALSTTLPGSAPTGSAELSSWPMLASRACKPHNTRALRLLLELRAPPRIASSEAAGGRSPRGHQPAAPPGALQDGRLPASRAPRARLLHKAAQAAEAPVTKRRPPRLATIRKQ